MQLRASNQIHVGESPVIFKNAPPARSMRTVVSLSHLVGQVTLAGGGEALELLESGVLWLGRGYLYAIS